MYRFAKKNFATPTQTPQSRQAGHPRTFEKLLDIFHNFIGRVYFY